MKRTGSAMFPLPAIILLLAAGVAAAADGPPRVARVAKAPPLGAPAGPVIRVATVEQLFDAAEKVQPGGTILLADGLYRMPRYFELHTDRVTLRSASGRRESVVLDGSESRHGELVGVTACSGVTIADLSIQNVKFNGFKINSDRRATRVTVRNCVIRNVWQRGVKGPAVRLEDREKFRPTDCRIEYCLFTLDRPKRLEDDPADTFGGDYVGGIDVMCAQGWTIADNVFAGIHGRNRQARGAIFVWNDSRDCTIERNVIVDCDAGICLGNSYKPPETPVHCTRCVVRNNFVTRCPESGIVADYTRQCKILHNTIHDPGSRLGRLIRLVHANDGLVVANNLLSGPAMRIETQDPIAIRGNVTREMGSAFADVAQGDLHLRSAVPGVVGAVEPLAEVPADFDRQPRGPQADVGADQYVAGVYPGTHWETRRPEEVGLARAGLDAMRELIGGRGCVVRHGYLVYTWGDVGKRADVASACKPWYTHFLLKAVEDGRIPSLDEKLGRWEPRLEAVNKDLGYKDRAIAWRHVANQTSCYGVAESPGTAYDYNDWQMALFLDTLFLKVYGVTHETLDAKVLHPLLSEPLQCEDNPTFLAFDLGSSPGRVGVSVRDFARFGLLYLRQGNWRGKQLLRREHAVMAVSSPLPNSIPRTAGKQAEMIPTQRTLGSRRLPDDQTDHFGSYSWLWWVNGVDRHGQRMWPDAPADTFGAFGHGGPRGMFVIPSLDLIVSYNDADKLAGWLPGPGNPTNKAMKRLVEAVLPKRRFAGD